MNTIYEIIVVGNPLAKNKKRAQWVDGKPKVYADNSHRPWSALVMDAIQQAGLEGRRLTGALGVDCYWRFNRPNKHYRTGKHAGELRKDAPSWRANKPDRDNLDKAVLDAMTQAGVWLDDAQAVCGYLEKGYCDGSELPGVTIKIMELPL